MDCDDLIRLAVLTARGGRDDAQGWPFSSNLPSPTPAFHARVPADDHLYVGHLGGIDAAVEDGTQAVVLLCRVGTHDAPSWLPHLTVWLIDTDGPKQNPNLEQVLGDTAEQILRMRQLHGDTRVYVHCAAGASRTPHRSRRGAGPCHRTASLEALR